MVWVGCRMKGTRLLNCSPSENNGEGGSGSFQWSEKILKSVKLRMAYSMSKTERDGPWKLLQGPEGGKALEITPRAGL